MISEKCARRRFFVILLFTVLASSALPALSHRAKAAESTHTVRITKKNPKTTLTMQVGDKVHLQVTTPKKTVEVSKATFSSSKKKVATVSKRGVIRAKKAGRTAIRIKYKNRSAKIVLTVQDAVSPTQPVTPGSAKTIKNYLAGALTAVGKVLYVWGGGWTDANRKGLSPTMLKWYNSQSSNYDYHQYNDLTTANRVKGFDCSGFVGWSTYQVMHAKSNEGSGYTCVSGDVGGYYKAWGWGSRITPKRLKSRNYALQAGDIGYNAGHVYIVIGQCPDKSVVVVHSTPQAGVQIGGTTTPDGNSNSQAYYLAYKYMQQYPGTKKYRYSIYAGNMLNDYYFFRWNRKTLADPDGYTTMSAEQILKNLYGY